MKRKSILGIMAALSVMLSAAHNTVFAEDSVIYGTMDIPYSDFYAAEFGTSPNAYEVDAYSSATTTKWSKNGAGELFEGTYNQANEDGTGSILGVTYPVAVTQSVLDELAENNYNFTKLDTVPSAYKNVTISDGKVIFSAVKDETPETASDAKIKLSTSTPWGDYLIDVEDKPEMGAIYGALIKTSEGKTYAMRHEENIWHGELAWSSGIKKSEPHGNTLSYENFTDLMGATITEVTFITADGYVTIPTETYVPFKFNGEVKIEDSASGTGSTSFTLSDFPEDFAVEYSLSEGFTVTDEKIDYTDAMPGTYTLTVLDKNGKYAEMAGSFTLTTDSMPAAYGDKTLIKAEGASEDEFSNFIKNITSVTVNEKEYKASGKGAVKIISEDGTIDFDANSKGEKVFDGSGDYAVSIKSAGYNKTLDLVIKENAPVTTESTSSSDETETTTTTITTADEVTTEAENIVTTVAEKTTALAASTEKANETTSISDTAENSSDEASIDSKTESSPEKSTTKKASSEKSTDKKNSETTKASGSSDSPKTGDKGLAAPLTALAFAGLSAALMKRKNK